MISVSETTGEPNSAPEVTDINPTKASEVEKSEEGRLPTKDVEAEKTEENASSKDSKSEDAPASKDTEAGKVEQTGASKVAEAKEGASSKVEEVTESGKNDSKVGKSKTRGDIILKDLPYNVLLHCSNIDNKPGVIIDKYWIATASHHVRFVYKKCRVEATGGKSTRTKYDVVLHQVNKIVQTENELGSAPSTGWPPVMFPGTLVLMRLQEPFEFDETTQPLELPERKATIPPGTNATAAIFDWNSDRYRIKEVRLMDTAVCNITHMYAKLTNEYLCADGYFNPFSKGGCDFDIGTPLTVGNRLIGLAAYDGGCSAHTVSYGRPRLFINITYHRSWIDRRMRSHFK